MAQLVRAPACKAGDPGSNPGPSENFSLKLTWDLPEDYSEKLNFHQVSTPCHWSKYVIKLFVNFPALQNVIVDIFCFITTFFFFVLRTVHI